MTTIRKITTNEIQAVGAILQDKEAIELLKKINDNIVTEEDTKGKRKQNDIFQFVGFAHDDDVLGEDKESEEYQQKAGTLKKLVDAGLLLEGFHIPLERGSEKKYGDIKVSSQERVGKYKLTEEGLTVLALVGKQQQQESQQQGSKQSAVAAEGGKNKSKAVANFKKDIKEENKL